jgi:hypothetical protein
MRRSNPGVRLFLVAILAMLVAAATVASASAAKGMKVGFYDEALTLGYPDDFGFRTLADLRADVVRMNLYWNRVATSRPRNPRNPNDPAYDWSAYDTALERADRHGIEVMLTIFGTPEWASGKTRAKQSYRYAPRRMSDLRDFATAAAKRYRQVDLWTAWNEPNAPNFLKPQSVKRRGEWVFRSPQIYARICNAVVTGVNRVQTRDKVACGVLNPRGELEANGGRRESVAPLVFLRLMKQAGARPEVFAYHPYSPSKKISPTKKVKSEATVTLGSIDKIVKAVNRAWGKRMRIWVTEYGYQTNPPDRHFGVSWKRQAQWMRIAFNRMRKNTRIDLALWFQLKDDSRLAGWQAGVISTHDVRKPSYQAFRRLAR